MSQINRLNRFLAGVIAVTFFVTNTLSPAPLAHAQSVESPSFVSSFKIPEAFGHVNEILPASANAPVLIHIQEAHANFDAQKNIQSILRHLNENYGVNLILMEGAGYKLTPAMFHFFSNDAALQKKANDKLLQAGELTGAEVFMMDAPAKAEAWGVEDAGAYGKDRESFRSVFKGRALADDFLDGFYLQWQKQAGVALNKELRAFLDRYVSYEEGKSSLADWLETLKKDARSALELDLTEAAAQGAWPTLVRYFRLKKVSAEIDLAKSEVEKKKFFSEAGLPVSVAEEVNQAFNVAKTGSLPVYETRFVFERLMDALPKDFSFETYPNLRLHIQQIILLSELQSEALQQEIRALAKKIVEATAKTEGERKHVALLREYQLLKKLFHLELSREEYQQVLTRGVDPEKLAASLKGSETRDPGSEKNLSLTPALSDLFGEALNFYKGAIEREDFMMKKALERMKESQQTKAVLITGGFHTEGFKEKILSAGNAYVGITPNIGEIAMDSQENYLTALLGQDSIQRSHIAPVVRSEIRFQREVSPRNWRREMAAVGARVSEIIRQVSPEGVPAVHRNFVSAVLGSQGRSEARSETQGFSTEMSLEAAGRLLQKLGIEVKGAEIRGAQQQRCPWNDALVLAKVQLVRGVHFSEISVLYDRSKVGQERRLYSEENHMIRYGWGPEFDPQTERLVFRTYADEARKAFTDRPIQDKKLEEVFGKTPATTAERDLSISRSEARGQFGFTHIAEVKAFLEANQERFDEREQFILLHRLKVEGGEFWTYAKIAEQSERRHKPLRAPATRGITGQAIGTAEEKIFAKLGYLLARPSKIQNPQNATLKDIVDEIRFWQNKSNLGVRLENLIHNIEIPDLKTLRRMKGTDFAQYRNIGKEVIGALREALSDYGLGDLGVEEPVQTRARARGREDEDPLKKAAQAVGVMQDSSGIFEKLLQLPGAVALVADEVLSSLDRLSTSEQRFALLGLFGPFSAVDVLIRMLRFPERGAVLQSLQTKEGPKSLFYTLLYTGRHQEAAKTESAYDLALQAVKEYHLEAARVLEILAPKMEDAQKKQVFEALFSQIQPLSGEAKAEAPYRTSAEEGGDQRALLSALEAIGTPEAMLQVLLHSDIQNLPLKTRLFVQKEGGADSLVPFLPEFFVKGQSSDAKDLTRFLAPKLSEASQTELALQLVSRKYAGDTNFPFYDAVESIGFLGNSPSARFFSLVLRPLKHFDYGPALRVKGVDVAEGLLALLRSKDGRMAHEAHFVFDTLFLDLALARRLFAGREKDLYEALEAFPEERLKDEAKSARSRAREFRRIFPEVTTTLTSKRSETREEEKIDDYKTYAYALLEDPIFRPIALGPNSGIRRTYQFILRHHSPFRPEDFLDFAAIAQMTGLAACTVRWYEGFATAHVVGLNRYLDGKFEERDARNKGEIVVGRSEARQDSKREKILETELSLWSSNEYQSVLAFAAKLHRLERTLQAMAKIPWNDEAVAKAFEGYLRKFMAPSMIGIPQAVLVERSLLRLFSSGEFASVVKVAALKVIESPEELIDEGYRDAVIKVTEALANRASNARVTRVREVLALSDGFMGSSAAAFLWGSASTVAGMFSSEQNEFLTLKPTTQQEDLGFLREIHQRSALQHAKMLFEEKFKALQKKQKDLIEPSGEAAEVVYAQVRDLVASRGGFEIVPGNNGSFKIVPEKTGELNPWSELYAKAAAAEVKDVWISVPNPPLVLSRVSPDAAKTVLQALLGEGNVARIQMLGYTPEPLVTIQNGQVLVRLNFIHWREADGFYVRKDGLLGFTTEEDGLLPDATPEVTAGQLLARSETRMSGSKPTAFEKFLDQRIQNASTQAEGLKRRTSLYGDASEQASLLAEQIRGDEKLLRSLTVERVEEDRWPKRLGPEEDLGPRVGGRSETREGAAGNLLNLEDDPVEMGINASENFIGEKEALLSAWRSFKKHYSQTLSFPIVTADLPTIEKALLDAVDQLQKSRGQRIFKRSLITVLGAGIVSRALVELPGVNTAIIGGIFAVAMAALIVFVVNVTEQPSAYAQRMNVLSGIVRGLIEHPESRSEMREDLFGEALNLHTGNYARFAGAEHRNQGVTESLEALGGYREAKAIFNDQDLTSDTERGIVAKMMAYGRGYAFQGWKGMTSDQKHAMLAGWKSVGIEIPEKLKRDTELFNRWTLGILRAMGFWWPVAAILKSVFPELKATPLGAQILSLTLSGAISFGLFYWKDLSDARAAAKKQAAKAAAEASQQKASQTGPETTSRSEAREQETFPWVKKVLIADNDAGSVALKKLILSVSPHAAVEVADTTYDKGDLWRALEKRAYSLVLASVEFDVIADQPKWFQAVSRAIDRDQYQTPVVLWSSRVNNPKIKAALEAMQAEGVIAGTLEKPAVQLAGKAQGVVLSLNGTHEQALRTILTDWGRSEMRQVMVQEISGRKIDVVIGGQNIVAGERDELVTKLSSLLKEQGIENVIVPAPGASAESQRNILMAGQKMHWNDVGALEQALDDLFAGRSELRTGPQEMILGEYPARADGTVTLANRVAGILAQSEKPEFKGIDLERVRISKVEFKRIEDVPKELQAEGAKRFNIGHQGQAIPLSGLDARVKKFFGRVDASLFESVEWEVVAKEISQVAPKVLAVPAEGEHKKFALKKPAALVPQAVPAAEDHKKITFKKPGVGATKASPKVLLSAHADKASLKPVVSKKVSSRSGLDRAVVVIWSAVGILALGLGIAWFLLGRPSKKDVPATPVTSLMEQSKIPAASPVRSEVRDQKERYQDARAKLTIFGQEHVLAFWGELDATQREHLLGQVERVDWEEIARLKETLVDHPQPKVLDLSTAEPVRLAEANDPEDRKAGEELLSWGAQENKAAFGVVLMAGGSGARFREYFPYAKGLFKGLPLSEDTLFESMVKKYKAFANRYGHTKIFPFIIVTSDVTHDETMAYFEAHRWFGMQDRIKVVKQKVLPVLVQATGKALMEDKGKLTLQGGGHGDAFDYILQLSGVKDWLSGFGVRTVLYSNIDNPLYPLDVNWVGAHARFVKEVKEGKISLPKGFAVMSEGLIRKKDRLKDKLSELLRVNGIRMPVHYSKASPELRAQTSHGTPSFRMIELPLEGTQWIDFSVADKKWDGIDGKGQAVKQVPVWKFERNSDDKMSDGANFPFENEDTFASIKEPPGKEESPDTSRALQTKHWKIRLEAAGYQVGEGFLIQLPWAADFMTPEELRRKLDGTQFPKVLNEVLNGQMVKGYLVHEDWTWGAVRSEARETKEIDKDVLSLKNAGELIERFFAWRKSVRGYNLNSRSVGHRVAEVDTVRGTEKRLVMLPAEVKADASTAMVTELLNNMGTKKDSKIPAFKKVQFERINPSVTNPLMEKETWGGISDLWKRDKVDLVTIIEPNFTDLPAMIRTAKKLLSKKTNSFIVVSLTRGDTNAFLEDGRFRSDISPQQVKKTLADFRIVRLPAKDPQWSPNGDGGVILFVYSPQGRHAIDALSPPFFEAPWTSPVATGESAEKISARSELREVVELIVTTSLLLSFVGVGVLIQRLAWRPFFYRWQRIPEYILYRHATSKLDPAKEKDQQVLLALRHILKGSTLLSHEFRDSHYNEQYDAWTRALDLAKDADEVKYLLEILVRRDLRGRYPYGPVYFTVRDLEYAPLIGKIREVLKESGKRQPSGAILLDKKTQRWVTDEALMKGIHFEPHAKAPVELIPVEDAKTPRILVADTDVGGRFLMGLLLKKFPRAKVSVARVDSDSSSEFWKKMKGSYDLVLANLDVTGTTEEWESWTEEALLSASVGKAPMPLILLSSQLERPLVQKMAQEGFVAGIIEKPKKITVDSKGSSTYRLSAEQTQALNALLEKQGLKRSEMREEGSPREAVASPEKLSELTEAWGKAGITYSYLNELIEGMRATQRSPFEKLRRLTNEMYLVKNGLEAIVNSISGDNLDVVKKRIPDAIQVLTGISRRMEKQDFLRVAVESLADREKSWASLLYLAVKLASFRDLFDKREEKSFAELKEKALASAASFKATSFDRGSNEARDVAYQRFWFDLDRLPIPAKEDDLMLFLESLAQDILNEVLSDPKPSEEGIAYDIFKYRTYSYYLQEGIKRKATFTFKSTTDSIVGLGYREADGPQYLPVFDRGGFGYFSSAEGQEMKTRATLIGGPLWEAMLGTSGMVQVFDALTGVGYKTYAISDLISNGLPTGIPQKQGFQVLKFVRLDGRQRIEIGRTGHPLVTALIGLAKEKPFRGEQSYAEYLTSECAKVLDNPQALEELLEQVTYLSSATARDEFGPALKAVMTFAAFLTPHLLEDMKSWDKEHYKRLKAILENENYRDLFQKGSIHFHKTDPSTGFAISRTLDGKVLTAAVHFSGNHYKQNNEKVWFRAMDPEAVGIRNTPSALYVVRDRLRQLIFGERTGASFFQSYGLSGWHLGVDQDDRSQILEVVPFSEELKERVTAVFKEREWTLPLDVTDFSVKVVVRPEDAKPAEIAAALEAVLKDLKKDLPRLQGRINIFEQHDIENVENVVLDVFRSEVRVLASLVSAPSLLAVSAAAVLGMRTGVLLWQIRKNRAIALKQLPEYFDKEQLGELIRLYRDGSLLDEDDAQELMERLRDLFSENNITENFDKEGRLKLWRIGGVATLREALKSFEAKAGRSEVRVGEEDIPRIKEALIRVAETHSEAGIRKTAKIFLDTGLSSHGRKGFKEVERANHFLESLKRSEAREAKLGVSAKEIQRRETAKAALKKLSDAELMGRLTAIPKSEIPAPTLERLAAITAYYHESDRIPTEWRTLVIQTISAYSTPAEKNSPKEKEALPATLESLYYESIMISKYPKDIDVAMTLLGMNRTVHLSSQFLEKKKDEVLGLLRPLLQAAQAQGTNPQKGISFWVLFGHTPRPSLKREEEAALAWGQQLGLWTVQKGLDRILPKQSAPTVSKEKEISLEGNPLIGKFIAFGIRTITSLGAPGSGKGTLLEWFVAELNKELVKGGVTNEYKILTVSDHLKPVLQAQFPEEYEKMKSGVLVSDDIIIQVINSVLAREEYANAYGIIFDGFPRTNPQWERVAELQWKGKPVVPEMHIIVDAPDAVLFERMAGRVKEDWAKGKVRPDSVNAVIVQDSGVTIDREAFQEVYDNRMKGYKTDTAPMIEKIRTTQADKTVAVASAEEKADTKKRFLTNLGVFLANRSEVRKTAPISPTSAKLPSERDLELQRLKTVREQAKLQGPASGVESAQPQIPERSREHVTAQRQIIFRNSLGLHQRPAVGLQQLHIAVSEDLRIVVGIQRVDNQEYAEFSDSMKPMGLGVEDGMELTVKAQSMFGVRYEGDQAVVEGVLDIFEKALQDTDFLERFEGYDKYLDEIEVLQSRYHVPTRSEARERFPHQWILEKVRIGAPSEFYTFNKAQRGGSEAAVRSVSEKIMDGIYPLLANSLNVIEKLIPAAMRLAAAQKIHAEAARRTLGITKVQDSDVFILDAALAIDKGAAAVMGKILNGVPIAVLVREGAQGDQDIAFIREHIQPLLLAQKQAPVLIARNLEEAKAELSKKVRTQKTAPSYKALVMATGLMAAELTKQLGEGNVVRVTDQMYSRFLERAGQVITALAQDIQAQFALGKSA